MWHLQLSRAAVRSTRFLATSQTRRTFIKPTLARQDLVQDMYLRELKAYKPTPVKASDAEGHVLKFNAPKPPKSPEEADIANDLKSYEAQTVDVEGQSETGAPAKLQDWFEEPEEEEHAAGGH